LVGDAFNGVFTAIIRVWIVGVVGTITSGTIVTGVVIT